MALVSTCVLLQGNPINRHRDLQPLFPTKPTSDESFILPPWRLAFGPAGARQRRRAGTRCNRRRTCKRDPAALRRRRRMAQGKRASSLSNYAGVCAGVNKRVCTWITVMSKALMRIPWTSTAPLPEYFSRCQHFEWRLTPRSNEDAFGIWKAFRRISSAPPAPSRLHLFTTVCLC